MGQVTIQTLGHFSTYGNGPKGDYLVTIAGDDRELALFHDSSSKYNAPQVGDQFPAEIVKGKRGEWRLKRASGGGATSSTDGGSSSTGGGGYSPESIARMSRSHAQEMALLLITATGDADELNLEDRATVGAYLNGTFSRLVRWFEADVEKAGADTKANPQPQQNGAPQEVPVDTTDLQPAPVPATAGDDVPF